MYTEGVRDYWLFIQCLMCAWIKLAIPEIRMMGCNSNGTLEMTEFSTGRIDCYDFFRTPDNTTFRWSLIKGRQNVTEVGTCFVNEFSFISNCSSPFSPSIQVTTDDFIYRTTFLSLSNVTREQFGDVTAMCASENEQRRVNATCRINVVYSTNIEPCSFQTRSQDWTLAGSCDIIKVYSSADVYTCMVQYKWNETSYQTLLGSFIDVKKSPFTDVETRWLYYRVTCNFYVPLPATNGNVPYSIVLNTSPGSKSYVTTGNLIIANPSEPVLQSCASNYIPEMGGGSSGSCQCQSSNMGSPAGRLVWMTGSTVLVTGNYGQSVLKFPYERITRNHSGLVLACQLDWIVRRNTSFTAQVSYGPDMATIRYQQDIYLNGSVPFVLTCLAVSVFPDSAYSVQWDGLCSGQQGPTCTLFVKGSEVDGKKVSCTVNNSLNNGHSALASVQLNTSFPPVDPPDIAGYMNQPLFEGDSLDLVCTVKGGKPAVLSVTLSCPGVASLSSNVTAYGQEVKITINVVAKDHLHECICTSKWLWDDAYTLHSKIVLLVFNGTRPDWGAISAARGEGVGIGVGVMVVVVALAVAVAVTYRQRKRLTCFGCDKVYDHPKEGQREPPRIYTDLSTYECVEGHLSLRTVSSDSQHISPATNVYANCVATQDV